MLDEPNTFLAIAEWESRAARDFMDKDTEEGTSERAKRYRASTVNEDEAFGTSVTVARIEEVEAVMPKVIAGTNTQANDAVTIAPDLHEVIFENDKIRVLKVTVPPGAKAAMHWHPENMNYILAPGKLKFTKPDGSVAELALTEGQVTSSPAGSHEVENTDATELQTIQVEMKQ